MGRRLLHASARSGLLGLLLVVGPVLLFAQACSKAPPPPPLSSASAPPAVRIPASDFLLASDKPPAGFGAYGYLLFTVRPTPASRPRYLEACKDFLRVLNPVGDFKGEPAESLMVTYWLLKQETARTAAACEALVDNYDYPRAAIMCSALGKSAARGPVLVAWSGPFVRGGSTTRDALLIDMSRFADADIAELLQDWAYGLSRPALAKGFNVPLIKTTLRSVLNTYGENVLVFLKLSDLIAKPTSAPAASK